MDTRMKSIYGRRIIAGDKQHLNLSWPFTDAMRQRKAGNILLLAGVALLFTNIKIPLDGTYLLGGYLGIVLATIGAYYLLDLYQL